MSVSGQSIAQTEPFHDLEGIRALVADDLAAVDEYVRQCLASDVVLIRQIGEHIVGGGGKRLRPIIHLLAARALGYRGPYHVNLAAIIEFIHTATLLHDDVVDESDLRRGQETANAVWGNAASVLVGDFLYSRSFQMMVDVGSMRVMDLLAQTTNTIAEGEVLQLMHLNNPETTEQAYLQVIRCKTAQLFEAAGRLAAVIADQEPRHGDELATFGRKLGIAFQLADDVLDYTGSPEALGKNVGDDLEEGKPTLPLIRVLEVGSPEQQALMRDVLSGGGIDRLPEVLEALAACDALAYARQRAETYCSDALSALLELPPSTYRDALAFLVEFSLRRDS
ncbi:MAG: octaprenyl diphosphate synthase [Pseudomonadota bacterium]